MASRHHVIDVAKLEAGPSNERSTPPPPPPPPLGTLQDDETSPINATESDSPDAPMVVPPVPAVPDGPTNGWTQQIEVYVSSMSLKCKDYRNIHEGSTIHYDRRSSWFTIFLIFVSFMVSAISLIPFFTGEAFKYVIALLSVFTTTLTTVNKFLRYQELSTRHRLASQRFLELHRNITEQFLLPFADRSNGKQYFQYVGRSLDQILKTAPFPPEAVLNRRKVELSPDSDVPVTSRFQPDIGVINQQPTPSSETPGGIIPPQDTLQVPYVAPIQSVNPQAPNTEAPSSPNAGGYAISAQARYQLRRARADLDSFAGDYD